MGLGDRWNCVFANDIDETKAACYRHNFGDAGLCVKDIHRVKADELEETALLAWASFPCQDLSLAGKGGGLAAERRGTFWPDDRTGSGGPRGTD